MTIAKYTITEPLLDLDMTLGEGCVWVSTRNSSTPGPS